MTNYFQRTFLTLMLGLPFISATFYTVGVKDMHYTIGERTTLAYEDDIVFDLNLNCPVTEYNVTTGQRIIVICSQRESMMVHRIYASYNPETIYLCDTFDPKVHIVGSCLGGLRHYELPLTVCEEGLDCQIPMQKGKSVVLFNTEQSCIHQVNLLKVNLI
ncbi:hypothetical protein FGIG_07322 [Fasciola gigantica]|uniref:Uncharacterized protein n=1 Tax=Fasciola gigantica TaxID=46835 RepID=A0A504YFU5_FASGI|nr:hypothetical protein FGIG_07322 [Fasciola gigantica]